MALKPFEDARRKWTELECRKRLARTPAWRPLQDYLERTRSTGCSYIDYWHLYRTVTRYRPAEILELGTGASTIVLAHAAIASGAGRITSMEESRQWYEHAVFNQPGGLPVEIIWSETVEDAFSIFRGVRYKDVPDRPYEFVFVDGPSYRTERGEVAFDFDLIRVVSRATVPVRAIVDKRISTCFVLQRVLPGKVRYVRHLGLGFVDAVTRSDLRGIDDKTPSASFKLGAVLDFNGVRRWSPSPGWRGAQRVK